MRRRKPTRFQQMATAMLRELEGSRLAVAKQKTDRGYVRVVLGENPQWYQEFCAAHAARRSKTKRQKFDTAIKRQMTLKALRLLARGAKPMAPPPGMPQPAYCDWLRPVVRREMVREREQLAAERESAQRARRRTFEQVYGLEGLADAPF